MNCWVKKIKKNSVFIKVMLFTKNEYRSPGCLVPLLLLTFPLQPKSSWSSTYGTLNNDQQVQSCTVAAQGGTTGIE